MALNLQWCVLANVCATIVCSLLFDLYTRPSKALSLSPLGDSLWFSVYTGISDVKLVHADVMPGSVRRWLAHHGVLIVLPTFPSANFQQSHHLNLHLVSLHVLLLCISDHGVCLLHSACAGIWLIKQCGTKRFNVTVRWLVVRGHCLLLRNICLAATPSLPTHTSTSSTQQPAMHHPPFWPHQVLAEYAGRNIQRLTLVM